MTKYETPETNYAALVLSLRLAINATDEERAAKCVLIAEAIAAQFSEAEVESAKTEATL